MKNDTKVYKGKFKVRITRQLALKGMTGDWYYFGKEEEIPKYIDSQLRRTKQYIVTSSGK